MARSERRQAFYDFVAVATTTKADTSDLTGFSEDWTACLDLTEDVLDTVLGRMLSWTPDIQMEYMRILENRYLQTQPVILERMAHRVIETVGITPLVRLETVRWCPSTPAATGRQVWAERVLPLLEECWASRRDEVGVSYLLNYIGSIVEIIGLPIEERGMPRLTRLLTSILNSLMGTARTEDYAYRALLATRQILDRGAFTTILEGVWEGEAGSPLMSASTRLLLIQYLIAHPVCYDHTQFPTRRMIGFLESQLTPPPATEVAPWDRADAALILLDMIDGVTEDLRARAQSILREDYERGGAAGSLARLGAFYQNPENVHCISLDSAQEILDYLHEAFATLPHFGMDFYDAWVRESLRRWPQTEEDEARIWSSLCRISKDFTVHGRNRDRLLHIVRLVVRFIDQEKDSETGSELRRRFLEELIDMSGTCSTGFAIRLLNVLSGYRDFAIRIPPEHALRCRFFLYLNQAMLRIQDEDARAQIMDELTLPASHYSERIHFLEFFAGQLPVLKETLYQDFKDLLTDEDFDFYLRKCIYHYEGGQGDL